MRGYPKAIWAVVLLGFGGALVTEAFSSLTPSESLIHLAFQTLALTGCGLLGLELSRNRRLSLELSERLLAVEQELQSHKHISSEEPMSSAGNPESTQMGFPHGNLLSSREVAVLRLVLQGLPSREIAARLRISASAVKNTVRHLFTKTGVHKRSQLVRVAFENYPDLF